MNPLHLHKKKRMNFIVKKIVRSKYYNFLRYSLIPNAIVEWKTNKTKKNIEFYASFLPVNKLKGALIFDVGANKGNKTKAFLKLGCKVVCVEPEQKCLGTLRYRYANNPAVTIIDKGLSDKEGQMVLHIQEFRSGYNTLSDKWMDSLTQSDEGRGENAARFIEEYAVDITTLDHLISQLGKPFYIKIDVEGLELSVIKGLSQPVPFISFEANLPEFKSETIEIIRHIDRLSDGTARYNVAFEDELIQKEGLNLMEMISLMEGLKGDGFEIICSSPVHPE
jgi:FkbM family methyltransferase